MTRNAANRPSLSPCAGLAVGEPIHRLADQLGHGEARQSGQLAQAFGLVGSKPYVSADHGSMIHHATQHGTFAQSQRRGWGRSPI